MASSTVVFPPIMKALKAIEDHLGAKGWEAVNQIQKKFLGLYASQSAGLARLTPEELRAWASASAEELNRILAENGFDIRLEEFSPSKFGVVSILDVLVEWLAKGQETSIEYRGKNYPAVSMKSVGDTEKAPQRLFEVRKCDEHPYPVACVKTKSGDRTFMTIAFGDVADFALADTIEKIRSSGPESDHCDQPDKLEFPMVDLDQLADISWLLGMQTADRHSRPWEISQALQQTKFRMNTEGARVKSAVAVGMRMLSANLTKIMRIDRPFLFWIEREGLGFPIMYAYIDTEDWKNPGSLKM